MCKNERQREKISDTESYQKYTKSYSCEKGGFLVYTYSPLVFYFIQQKK